MARKTKEDAAKTRVRILASALALFTKNGYERTTFSEIAARLKMTKGAVYWYFDSKEALLMALIELALDRFQHLLTRLMPTGELTFPTVAEAMVANAVSLVADPKGVGFFRLVRGQMKWGDASMAAFRERVVAGTHTSPKQTFQRALEADIAAGRVRVGVNTEEISSVCVALWEGLVQARIDHFLACDLKTTLEHAYLAIWNNIKTDYQGADKHE